MTLFLLREAVAVGPGFELAKETLMKVVLY